MLLTFSFCIALFFFFFFNDPATTEIYTLSLHDALPIFAALRRQRQAERFARTLAHEAEEKRRTTLAERRSEEHTSELQSHHDLVCRLLLEKKKKKNNTNKHTQTNTTSLNKSTIRCDLLK